MLEQKWIWVIVAVVVALVAIIIGVSVWAATSSAGGQTGCTQTLDCTPLGQYESADFQNNTVKIQFNCPKPTGNFQSTLVVDGFNGGNPVTGICTQPTQGGSVATCTYPWNATTLNVPPTGTALKISYTSSAGCDSYTDTVA